MRPNKKKESNLYWRKILGVYRKTKDTYGNYIVRKKNVSISYEKHSVCNHEENTKVNLIIQAFLNFKIYVTFIFGKFKSKRVYLNLFKFDYGKIRFWTPDWKSCRNKIKAKIFMVLVNRTAITFWKVVRTHWISQDALD